MSTQDHWKRSGMVEDINAAIRENPLAAGLIGAGALWMLFGRKGLTAAAVGTGLAAGKAGSAAFGSARSAAQAVGGASSSVASKIKSAASHTVEQAASIVPDMSTADHSDDGPESGRPAQSHSRSRDSFASSTSRYASNVKSTLADTFERQPLLLGGVGLAIGAAVAASFATTAVEAEWIGEKGAAAREKLKQAANEATGRAWQAGKEEAERQNLTEKAGWDASERLVEKAETVLKAGRESLQTAGGGSSGRQPA
jgi:hypothetical protein